MHAGGVVHHLPALEVLTVECSAVEQPLCSETLRCLELIGCGECCTTVRLGFSPLRLAGLQAGGPGTPRLLHAHACSASQPPLCPAGAREHLQHRALRCHACLPVAFVQVRPQLGPCAGLTRVHLLSLRPHSEEAYLEALSSCAALREVQLTFAYALIGPAYHPDAHSSVCISGQARLLSRAVRSPAVTSITAGADPVGFQAQGFVWHPWQEQQRHSRAVQRVLEGLLRMPLLTAVQLAAVHASLHADLASLQHLQHFALACAWLSLSGSTDVGPTAPSIHLLDRVR
jgi:hypothetical protein